MDGKTFLKNIFGRKNPQISSNDSLEMSDTKKGFRRDELKVKNRMDIFTTTSSKDEMGGSLASTNPHNFDLWPSTN